MRAPDDDDSHDVRVARLATRQCGVVGRRQLLAMGMSKSAIDRRIRAGRLIPLYRGVFAVGHEATSDLGRIFAALLAAPNAIGSHSTAAYLHKLTLTLPPFVEVTVYGRGGRSRPGLTIHETTREPPTVKRRGIRITDVRRTLEDLDDERITREARGQRPHPPARDPRRAHAVQRRAPHAEAHPKRPACPSRWSTTNSAPTCPTFMARPARRARDRHLRHARRPRDLREGPRPRRRSRTHGGFRVLRATDTRSACATVARLAATLSR